MNDFTLLPVGCFLLLLELPLNATKCYLNPELEETCLPPDDTGTS
jgi:hypothetical protein